MNTKSITCEPPHIERAITCADSIDLKIDKTIDRLQTAKRSDYDQELFELARNRIASHHAKFAREQNRQPDLPDDAITARFLSVAEWPRLESLLCDLASERKEAGHSYAWYVTVALQRIRGISPNEWRVAQTRISRKQKQSIQSTPTNSIEGPTTYTSSPGVEHLKTKCVRSLATLDNVRATNSLMPLCLIRMTRHPL